MAYVLLALGALMSLVGLFAMITGYPMIEIERGWATMITGAVLFSGGLVVVALGLVVRNLVGLRGALATLGALPAAAEAPVPQPIVVPTPLMPSLPAAPPAFEMPPMTRPTAAAFEASPGLGVAVPAAAAALAAGALRGHEETGAPDASPRLHDVEMHAAPADRHDADPPAEDAYAPHAHDDFDGHVAETHSPETHVAEPHAAELLLPEPHVPETYVPEVHAPALEPEHHAPIAAHAAAEPTPVEPGHAESDKDWLDQAFSAFDYEMANSHPPAAEPASGAAHEPHPEPVHVAGPDHVAEPEHGTASLEPEPEHHGEHHEFEPHAAAEAPATAPAEPAANLAVIGRYDSEGTSYVMYSDGSIEAQSEAGVYRFGSMAELKAFIEN